MSNVTLDIAGREYTIACDPGEEEHIAMLGRMIAGKLSALPNLQGQSEMRRFLYAALLLADEVHELQTGGGALAAPASRADPGLPSAPELSAEAAEALEALADKLEGLAAELEAEAGAMKGDGAADLPSQ
jgi:cell division protein ZapA